VARLGADDFFPERGAESMPAPWLPSPGEASRSCQPTPAVDLPPAGWVRDASSPMTVRDLEPRRSRDLLFSRVHLAGKSLQGSARRAVLVRASQPGRQFGFTVARAEGGAGGEVDASEVDLYECFELRCPLPAVSLLSFELWRQGPTPKQSKHRLRGGGGRVRRDSLPGLQQLVTGSPAAMAETALLAPRLVGGFMLDLESRWLHPVWHRLGSSWKTRRRLRPVPVETRRLRDEEGDDAGSVQVWLDILEEREAKAFPPVVVAPPPPVLMQLRVVVWRVRGMEDFGWTREGPVPMFVRCWLHREGMD